MKVFISWSGNRSRLVGELLNNWLKCVLQELELWMSTKDIDRGSIWFSEIFSQLRDTGIGIICLTRENLDKPWILFEAGALAKGLMENHVCTLLIDVEPYDVIGPLSHFNHTIPTKDGIWRLIQTLNEALGEKSLHNSVLENVYGTFWPQFETTFNEIMSVSEVDATYNKRSDDEILWELLSLSRTIDRRLTNIENENGSKIFDLGKYMSEHQLKNDIDEINKTRKVNVNDIEVFFDKYHESLSRNHIMSIILESNELS